LERSRLDEAARASEALCTGTFTAWLIDLQSGEEWDHLGTTRGAAASVIKIPILIELYARAEAGDVDLDETVRLREEDVVGGAGVLFELHRGLELTLRDLGVLMTVVSDNTASNLLIDRLGMGAINERMKKIGMADSVLGRKFMIDPDALHAMNFTTAKDMAICLARLHRGELLSSKGTEEVVGILKRQQYREKIPLLLPETVPVAHKTGEISNTRHDTALVLLDDHPYALACLTWGVADVLAADRAIAELSRSVYDHMTAVRV